MLIVFCFCRAAVADSQLIGGSTECQSLIQSPCGGSSGVAVADAKYSSERGEERLVLIFSKLWWGAAPSVRMA